MSGPDRPVPPDRPALAGLPSREELLGGLPARRASTLLFAIESRTAQLVARSRQALITHVSERTAAEQERAFLAAMASGREVRAAPTIQDLDRYAPRWQELVPPDPQLRAALVQLVLRKYRVPRVARRLHAALGLDDPAVIGAYERHYGRRPGDDLSPRLTATDRLRWLRSRLADRLERMPPFATAYALTLTETVGGGILALPIALAGFGVLGSLGLLVVFGLVNVVTVAALCESITRNGRMRYGTAYFGRLVSDFLGKPGLYSLVLALVLIQGLMLLVGLIGFGDVLGGATGIHSAVWAAGLFAVTMLVLARGSLDATVASAIVIGSINLVVLMLIAGLTLASGGGTPALFDTPSPEIAAPLGIDPRTLALAFGVLLAAFFGHVSAGNAAKVVLARDPGGRTLLWGNVAAMATVIVVYGVVISAIFGALDERVLIGHEGTVITPLAEAVGPSIHVLGAIYATLALGIGSLYGALGLYNLAGEALHPAAARLGKRWRTLLAGGPPRFLFLASPAIAVFILIELLLLSGRASFSAPIAVLGTLAVPLLGGVFPMLMVAAARRRGDRLPAAVIKVIGHPVVVWTTWALFLAAVLAHVVIWEGLLDRLAAAAVAVATVVITYLIVRSGALQPQATLEVRLEADDPAGDPHVALLAGGRPEAVRTSLPGPDQFRVDLPALAVPKLRLWVHRLTGEESEGLALRVEIAPPDEEGPSQPLLLGADGEALVPLDGRPLSVLFIGLPRLRSGTASRDASPPP